MDQMFQNDPHRPRYHFLPPKNWMNDPNGSIQWRGEYHLFYQHYPQGPFWGLMHWGHAKSADLVHWTHLPIALTPTPGSYDKDGVFSGCAVDCDGVPTLVYTGVQPEVQCIATGSQDMLTWTKYSGNPVVAERPEGLDLTGFRDPCVWREDRTWYMALGSGIRGQGGAALLYRSQNLTEWEYVHPLCVGDAEKTGEMWECPSFFPLGGKHVLLVSVHGATLYFVGSYVDHKFVPEVQGSTDFGGHFYAAQTFADDRQRRIMWGWMWEGRARVDQQEPGWAGVLSLPRILTLAPGGRLAMTPAPELTALRERHWRKENFEVPEGSAGLLGDVQGDCLELRVTFALGGAEECGLAVRRSPGGEEETRVAYNDHMGTLSVHRDRSSLSEDATRDVRSGPFRVVEEDLVVFHAFLDRSVLEVFVNETACLSSRIYPARADSLGVDLFARGGTARVKSVDVWSMKSIWG